MEQQTFLPETVAIVGSREYPFLQDVRDYIVELPEGTRVVTGGARGVDREAENVCGERGIECLVLKPDWEAHGRKAGLLRNVDIVKAADRIVAFWDGVSRGTLHSIHTAQRLDKPVLVFPEEHRWVTTMTKLSPTES